MKAIYIIILITTLLTAVKTYPQIYLGYYFIPTVYGTYSEITGGTISSATGNDGAENITLPFPFEYMGITYNTARISVNGWLEMGQTYTGLGYENELESTVKKPLICPLWDDLYADSQSEIRYQTIGEYPARFFIIQWKNIQLFGGGRKSFQIRLWEFDGTIDFIYGSGTGSDFNSYSVGLNNHIGGAGNFISVTMVDEYSQTIDTMVANNMNDDVSILMDGMLLSFLPIYYEIYSGTKLYQLPDSVIVGNPNQKILAIIIPGHFGGVLTPPWVTQFNFNTNGTTLTSDIQNAKLYYTGSYPYFDTHHQLGATYPNPNGLFEIGGLSNIYLNDNNVSYFWLAYDISPDATVGNFVDGSCYRIDREGCCPAIIPDTTLATARCIISDIGIQGIITVGTGEDYENLEQAFNFLRGNILVGEVTLELTDNYNSNNEIYPIIIPKINNANELNTINIISTNQDFITFQHDGLNVFHFKDARYVILDGYDQISGENRIIIINTSTTGCAVYFSDGASYNIIKDCELQASDTSSAGAVVKFDQFQSTLSFQGNQVLNCNISKNEFGNVTNGVLFRYPFYPQSNESSNTSNIIKNCIIRDFMKTGISLNIYDSIHLIGNRIFQTYESFSPVVTGIYVKYGASAQNPHVIEGNWIYDLQPQYILNSALVGIKLPGASSQNIYNNFISLNGNELSSVCGITYASYGAGTNLNMNYNTILISGNNASDTFSAAFYREGYNSNVNMKNNLFINKRVNAGPNSKNYCIYLDNDYLIPELDYNNYYYTSGTNNFFGRLENIEVLTLNEWIALTTRDVNSSFTDISFVSEIDLHLTGSSLGDTVLIGTPLPNILTDIDGELRNPSFPYKGADENIQFPLPVELNSFTANYNNSVVKLEWETASEKNNSGFQIERSKSNSQQPEWRNIGFVPGNGTSTKPHHYTFIDKNLPSGKYEYRLKQIDYDGSFEYSKIVEVEVGFPTKFSLSQNYPNPFNPATSIKYEISSPQFVTIKVYDLLGREIATLVNEKKTAGEYKVEFSSANLPGGIYFYQLRAGDFVETKKMVLLK